MSDKLERWDRETADPAYLDTHTCARWAFLLATEDDLRAGVERLAQFDRHGAANARIVQKALTTRFPEAS